MHPCFRNHYFTYHLLGVIPFFVPQFPCLSDGYNGNANSGRATEAFLFVWFCFSRQDFSLCS